MYFANQQSKLGSKEHNKIDICCKFVSQMRLDIEAYVRHDIGVFVHWLFFIVF